MTRPTEARPATANTHIWNPSYQKFSSGAAAGSITAVMTTGQIIPLAILGVLAGFIGFVVWWWLVGWGVSIAMRAYRWGIGPQDRVREYEQRQRALAGRPTNQKVDKLAHRG